MTEVITSGSTAAGRGADAVVTMRALQDASGPGGWGAKYRYALFTADSVALVAAIATGYVVRFASAPTVGYVGYGIALAVGWLIALQNSGGYDIRHLAIGPTESKAVLRASGLTVSVLAVYCYATKTEVARGFVVEVIPVGIVLLMLGRLVVRTFVMRQRRNGQWAHRILAVGTSESVEHLVSATKRARGAGLVVVGACVEDSPVGTELHPGVPVIDGVVHAAAAAVRVRADVVAVTGSGLGPASVRQLGWALEGTGRGLVLAPSLTEIAGPRVRVSPVDGLPLMWVEQPRLGRVPRALKRLMDITGGLFLLALASPLLLVAAIAIKLDSRGPALFRQSRLGANGTEFTLLKLRSMHVDSEERRADILELNEQDGAGVLFKIRRDPRITKVGRWIRQFSIDELPQLVHVVTGRMSLVGPRPLATADSTYTGSARRRLLVRPGLTGLWQVSGRSDLSWDDAVRLDLFYVENWSLGLDIGILARTVVTVLRRNGAY